MSKVGKDMAHAGNGSMEMSVEAKTEANTIEQVRELLFGQEKRTTEQRHREFEEKIEALHADMLSRFSMLESRLSDTERALDQQHNAALEEISNAITDLGSRVRKLVAPARGR